MGDAKGSPRPWVRFKVTDQPDMIGDAKDGVVCRPPAPSCYTDKWEVDADLIVSSVNARDAAIEAMEEAHEQFKYMLSRMGIDGVPYINADSEIVSRMTKLRAAISKLKGVPNE